MHFPVTHITYLVWSGMSWSCVCLLLFVEWTQWLSLHWYITLSESQRTLHPLVSCLQRRGGWLGLDPILFLFPLNTLTRWSRLHIQVSDTTELLGSQHEAAGTSSHVGVSLLALLWKIRTITTGQSRTLVCWERDHSSIVLHIHLCCPGCTSSLCLRFLNVLWHFLFVFICFWRIFFLSKSDPTNAAVWWQET